MVTGMTNYATSSDKNWFQGLCTCFSLSANPTSPLRSQAPCYSSITLQTYSGQLSKSLKTLSISVCVQHLFHHQWGQEGWAFPAATPHGTETLLQLQHSSSYFSYIHFPAENGSPFTQNLQELNPCSILLSDKWLTRLFPSAVLFPGKLVFSSLLEQPQNTHRTTAIETGRQPPTRHLGPVRSRVWQIIWGRYYIIKA